VPIPLQIDEGSGLLYERSQTAIDDAPPIVSAAKRASAFSSTVLKSSPYAGHLLSRRSAFLLASVAGCPAVIGPTFGDRDFPIHGMSFYFSAGRIARKAGRRHPRSFYKGNVPCAMSG
jgi:hypothetical protein